MLASVRGRLVIWLMLQCSCVPSAAPFADSNRAHGCVGWRTVKSLGPFFLAFRRCDPLQLHFSQH